MRTVSPTIFRARQTDIKSLYAYAKYRQTDVANGGSFTVCHTEECFSGYLSPAPTCRL